jgi:hypothetical protein
MAGKGKGASRSATKGTSRGKAAKKTPTPDRLPPATQAEDIALNPDKGTDRIPVLEPTANVPYVTPKQLTEKATGPEAKALAKQQAAQEKAAADTRAAAQRAADARKAQSDAEYKDKQSRTVKVQALRKGFYPADGRIRNPGEVFDYVPAKVRNPKTNKLEPEKQLPSWLQDVDGKLETREAGEPTPAFQALNPALTEQVRATNASSSVS